MSVAIKFHEPVVIYTAKQLAAMKLQDLQLCLQAQEDHCRKEQGVGSKAWPVLEALRQGGEITVDPKKKRNAFKLNGEEIKLSILRQLEKRGYITIPKAVY
ncbi:MAG: hypothetical protein PSX71_08805 [bacterium]|nr:hypothetical protein [bacterium]